MKSNPTPQSKDLKNAEKNFNNGIKSAPFISEEAELASREWTLKYTLNEKQQSDRLKLLLWASKISKKSLELKPKTIELAFRIFDYYCFKKI
jgi:hypothetical protein